MTDPVERVEELLRFSSASERLRALLPIITLALEQIVEVAKDDTDLLPELQAAADHLREASRAITRAHNFASERLSVKLGLPPPS